MNKVLLLPDSFKGSLTSGEVCRIMEEEILRAFPGCQVCSVPVADGGEGSVDCFLAALGGERVETEVSGPCFEPLRAGYGLLEGGRTAVIEMAACAGLPLVGERKNPLRTTTYGVGQQMAHALDRGVTRIILGLGGSATNDGGAGAAAALGVRFLDASGRPFVPTGGTLANISKIDCSGLSERLREVELVVMCDIDNPLCGPRGAAAVFGPQKGADPETVKRLDSGLAWFAQVISRDLGTDVLSLPGGGAAGGMGAGVAALLGGRLTLGIQAVLDTIGFEKLAQGADLILTGEGRLDSQSLGGKVIAGVARRAKPLGVPVVAVVGGAESGLDELAPLGISAVFSICRGPQTLEKSMNEGAFYLRETMKNLMAFQKICR